MTRKPMDELCYAAEHAGWWVELHTRQTRRDNAPRPGRLLVRSKTQPQSVRWIDMRGPSHVAIDHAARKLAKSLLEAA